MTDEQGKSDPQIENIIKISPEHKNRIEKAIAEDESLLRKAAIEMIELLKAN